MSLHEGMVIAERYLVLRPLGEGGMGAAYLVEDQLLGRKSVIKEVLVPSDTNKEQFFREARLLAGLQHSNLPVVYDFIIDGGQPFINMQFVSGETLDRKMKDRDAPLEIFDVLRWAKEILTALFYVHHLDPPVIHRDIKPQNICITPEQEAVLLDFGIARRLDESQTQTAAQAITVGYSPIEQYPENTVARVPSVANYVRNLHAQGIHTSYYSDIYGLGATLYYVLTMSLPPDARMRVLKDELIPIQQWNPEIPDFLATVVMKAMELDPRNRYQTADEMLAALQPESVEIPATTVRRRPSRPLPSANVRVLDRELIYIPAGKFDMGSDDPELKTACHPCHQVSLGAFCISRYTVTNIDYQRFIEDNPDYPIPHNPMRFAQRYNWDPGTRTFPRGLEDHPVVLVSWHDALAYCRWLSKISGHAIRLPSEAEWEKSASWDITLGKPRLYPWGDQFDEDCCNADVRGELRVQTTSVDRYSPAGDSPHGLADMAGNVWEWTGSLYLPYPYQSSDGREDLSTDGKRVVRGGAYDENPLMARCAWRNGIQTDLVLANVGFRVACNATD